MAGKDIVAMSQRELRRLQVIHQALEKRITQEEAAVILALSDRQIRRIIAKVRKDGNGAIAHQSRGKESNRRFPKRIKDKAIDLYREKYKGFGPTLASEKLLELDGIGISDETLRLWLLESGDWKKIRRSKKHRERRERKHCFGEMIQIDGSKHDWLEGRGPECVLMAYIDDATNRINCRFYEYEGTIPVMDSFKRYIRKYGIPQSLYLDRHTTYKSPVKPLWEGDPEALSQFERAMKEIGVEVIHANSPQAKGRVERLFKTLQDRLVKEMRLKGIKDMEEANRFLQQYMALHNRKFTVKPVKEANLHRAVPKGLNLDRILCKKKERTVKNDFTISYRGKFYQIKERTNASKVTVIEKANGRMEILDKNGSLKFKQISGPPLPEAKLTRPVKRRKPFRSSYPKSKHLWKRLPWKRKGPYYDPNEAGLIYKPKPDISNLVKIGHF